MATFFSEHMAEIMGNYIADKSGADELYKTLKAINLWLGKEGRMIIDSEYYSELLHFKAQATLEQTAPGRVVFALNEYGKASVVYAPAGVEVEIRDYRDGFDCDVCDLYVKNSGVSRLSMSPTGQPSYESRLCPACMDSAINYLRRGGVVKEGVYESD